VCGSRSLVAAEDYMLNALTSDELENVHGENVTIPHWVRGNEWAYMMQPRLYKLGILGLGSSPGCSNLTAPVVVVSSWADLQKKATQGLTQGRIVVYNQQCDWVAHPIDCYGMTADYRVVGAKNAAAVGGVAALVRSLASASIYSPHTGMIMGASIPTASLPVEDAEMLQRMWDRGDNIVISLHMEGKTMPDAPGRNIVAEITGSVYPDQTVIVSGHLDSWDVGQGAMDDGCGAAISWQALSYLRQLQIRPKRTIRMVMWSCEEFGGIGAQQYFDAHRDQVPSMDIVMESDMGTFHPRGIEFSGNSAATMIMREVGQLLVRINTTLVVPGGGGTDIDPWMGAGVPGASLSNENHDYFKYHHSNGDTMTVLNSMDMDLAAATWAVTALGVANLDDLLPR